MLWNPSLSVYNLEAKAKSLDSCFNFYAVKNGINKSAGGSRFAYQPPQQSSSAFISFMCWCSREIPSNKMFLLERKRKERGRSWKPFSSCAHEAQNSYMIHSHKGNSTIWSRFLLFCLSFVLFYHFSVKIKSNTT